MSGTPFGLWSYVVQLPVLLVWLIGIVFALVRWPRHPRVSLLALVAILLALVAAVGGNWLNAWVPLLLRAWRLNVATIQGVQAALAGLMGVILATSWAVILLAMFGWRDVFRS